MEVRELFTTLKEKLRCQQFDDEFLLYAIKFREVYPESAGFEICYGFYALAHGNVEVALEQAEIAFGKRRLNDKVLQLLVLCYEKLGDSRAVAYFQGLRRKFYQVPLSLDIKDEQSLDLLSLAMGVGNYAPFAAQRMFIKDGKIEQQAAVFAGEYLPSLEQDSYWVGAYAEQESMNGKNWLLETMRYNSEFALRCGADFVFDIQRAELTKSKEIAVESKRGLLAIAGTEDAQAIEFRCGDNVMEAQLSKWMFQYFRMDKPTVISSKDEMVVGKFVPLGHSPRRKKVVLNILVDAMSWAAQKERNYQDVPNIMRFFKRGIIFNNHFSVGEYTYPSFATIESGLTPHHSQLFNEQAAVSLDTCYVTMSEQMKQLGYYCVNLMGGGDGITNRTTRGYDRLLTTTYNTPAYEGVERTIRHLEAFGECDQFLLLHVMDVHPWRAKAFQVPLTTQTGLSLSGRVSGYDESRPSVYIQKTPLYEQANIDGVRNVDRALGTLFRYLEDHYADDEYIVQLYSDHGCSVYDDEPYLLSDHHVGAAYMMRGAGIPERGIVDELTSALDIYPALGKLAGFKVPDYVDGNLPAALGGQEREYVISNTMYPGQTFKMAVRTKDYECQLVTEDVLTTDGTVNMDTATYEIYCRGNKKKKVDSPELRAFFSAIIREYTKSFDNHGLSWQD
ncbi:Sulfatase [Selenomonas sp. WCT3]|uniref:sulfatase-like hydrolase/transferase n=1 Tax=Selenomonas sp. WCT3 TaxID=3158785 RepID=UPI00088322EE|nr:Sulfatase [Selenomonas ruminantium]